MRSRVLVGNNTYTDRCYLGRPTASYYIECGGVRLLSGAGYSDVLLENAEALGIDLGLVTHMVFSHGHNDHARKLKFMNERLDMPEAEVIAHPSRFDEEASGEESIGAPHSVANMAAICRYRPRDRPWDISEYLVFLGEVSNKTTFKKRSAIGRARVEGKWQDDYVRDGSALVYRGEEDVFIITGYFHSDVCSVVRYAQAVYGRRRILDIIGGFHLFEVGERPARTIGHLKCSGVEQLYPCHCVSLRAKAGMMEALPVEEVGMEIKLCLDEQTIL